MTEQELWIPILVIGGGLIVVLNIILFFKIWGMTNNTRKIILFLEAQRPDLEYYGGYPEKNIPARYRERIQEKND